mgnify:CR=1 FL=1
MSKIIKNKIPKNKKSIGKYLKICTNSSKDYTTKGKDDYKLNAFNHLFKCSVSSMACVSTKSLLLVLIYGKS